MYLEFAEIRKLPARRMRRPLESSFSATPTVLRGRLPGVPLQTAEGEETEPPTALPTISWMLSSTTLQAVSASIALVVLTTVLHTMFFSKKWDPRGKVGVYSTFS